MKVMSQFLLMIALVSCADCARTQDVRPSTASLPAVGLLKMKDIATGAEAGSCTAWKIRDGFIVTAGHCCSPEFSYTLSGPSAVPGAVITPILDAYDEDGPDAEDHQDNDACVLSGKMNGQPVELAANDPPIGGHVWTLGYPRAQFLISEGIWSGRNENNLGVCSSVVNPGASGSPMLDADSRAVGILVRYKRGMDNMAFVSPLENLRAAIRRAMLLRAAGKTSLE